MESHAVVVGVVVDVVVGSVNVAGKCSKVPGVQYLEVPVEQS